MESNKSWQVGDIVRPADGSGGRYVIVAVGPDTIRYQCQKTGAMYTKDRFGFFCRYSTLEEYNAREAELAVEAEGDVE